MATMHEIDQTIADMFALQQSSFDAGEAVFILTADHPSYLHTDNTMISRTHIPMLICHNSFIAQQIDKVGSTVDLFPTILDAFSIPQNGMTIADSLLQDAPNVVLFPTGTIMFRQEDETLQTMPCDDDCGRYFDYTDQAVRLSN
jgi:phosphoglycerol transferase MdoB-like AlkP superfamily enzyme